MSEDTLTGNLAQKFEHGLDKDSIQREIDGARNAMAEEAFRPEHHTWRNIGISAGTGFVAGSALTAAGEVALTKAVEPLAKPLFAIGFGMLGGGRMTDQILSAPPLKAIECLTPRPILIGGLVVAGLAAGAYGAYEYFNRR